MICCPGLDYCNLANARSIPIAKEIAKRFEDPARQEVIGPLRLNMSGCINACGHHHSGNIGILGVDKKGTELYQISLGGNPKDDAAVGTIIGPGFRAEAVPDAIDTIVSTYLANRHDGEDFLATWRRIGAGALQGGSLWRCLISPPARCSPSGSEPAVVLEPTADAAALAAAAANGGVVAIRFPILRRRPRPFARGAAPRASRLQGRDQGRRLSRSPTSRRSCSARASTPPRSPTPTTSRPGRRSLTRIRHLYQPGFRNPQPLRRDASKREAEELNSRLEKIESLAERIAEMRRSVEGRIAFSTSLGLDDQAILDAIAESGADIDIFTLDTGRLFPEVLETVELSEIRYGLRIRLVTPDAAEVEALVARDGVFGFRNSVDNRKGCCEVRKVRPLNRELKGAQGWITGIRREHSDERADVELASWDEERGLIKVNPIADWSTQELTAYIAENNVPVNPLHARGFISIGCQPCTRAVQPASIRVPAAGGGSMRRRRSAGCI